MATLARRAITLQHTVAGMSINVDFVGLQQNGMEYLL